MDEIRRPRGGYYPGDWVRPRPNPGGWTPIADTQEIHTGNRSTNCRPGGWVSVELLYAVPSRVHSDVEPVAGFTIADCGRLTGDAEDAVVTWNGRSDISPIGEMVGIRLRLFQATVFAYSV